MRKSPAAHPAQQLRGSGDFSAWLDSGLYLTRDGDDRVLVVEHRSAPAPSPFRLRLVPGNAPHLEIHDAHHDSLDSLQTPADPLQARILERLRTTSKTVVDPLHVRVLERLCATSRPHTTYALREALRVRKADLLALDSNRFVTRTALGWMLAESP